MAVTLFVVGLALRLYNLSAPNHVVFDEMHYGEFAGGCVNLASPVQYSAIRERLGCVIQGCDSIDLKNRPEMAPEGFLKRIYV